MVWVWYVIMSFFSAIGFGLAAFYAEGKPLVGVNVAIGVFCFTLALVSGIKHAVSKEREDK